jgi:hypothetical protein
VTRYAENTGISSENRRAQIERTLRRYGATGFAYAVQADQAVIEFLMGGRRVRFHLALPDAGDRQFTHTERRGQRRSDTAAAGAYEQAVRQRWAALSLVIKAKLEAIAAGISTIDEEFLAHVVLPDNSTVGERTLPQLDAAYAGSPLPALLPGGGR